MRLPAWIHFGPNKSALARKHTMEAQGRLQAEHGDIKIWSYDELQSVHNEWPTGSILPENPRFWPEDVQVDPGKWAQWLPFREGWGQGLRMTSGGTMEKIFISPQGKICWKLGDFQKAGGTALTVAHDWIPNEWPEWLPSHWGIARVTQRTRKVPIYVRPSCDRWHWHKEDVEKFISADPSLAESGQFPPPKRRKAGEGHTDSEIEELAVGSEPSDPNKGGFELRSCSAGAAWVAIPENLELLDLQLFRPAMESAGWVCASRGTRCDAFASGSSSTSDVTLHGF